MAEERAERRLTAILAIDVAGYSRLMGADEEGTLARLKAHRRELIDPKISEHQGRIVKTTGDGMLVDFASVVNAMRCAVEVQRRMIDRNVGVPRKKRIEFRIGINVGDIIVDGGDIYGDGVNVAARLEAFAEPGGICVSGQVQENTRGKLDIAFKDAGEQRLKNIARPVRVYRVRVDGTGIRTALMERVFAAVNRAATVGTTALRFEQRTPWQSPRRIIAIGAALGVFLICSISVWLANTPPGQVPATEQLWSSSVVPLSLERERALKSKDAFKECDKCPEMVVVPAGSFTMRAPVKPFKGSEHFVTIAKRFAIGRLAVLFDEWDTCVADGGCNNYTPGRGLNQERWPVRDVSWDDARAYVKWLSRKTGKTYRLLSEAEFEYAAHALGTVNAFGKYDLAGWISEWVEDCFHSSYTGAPADGSAWTSEDCILHVVRDDFGNARELFLRSYPIEYREAGVGFRVGRTLTP